MWKWLRGQKHPTTTECKLLWMRIETTSSGLVGLDDREWEVLLSDEYRWYSDGQRALKSAKEKTMNDTDDKDMISVPRKSLHEILITYGGSLGEANARRELRALLDAPTEPMPIIWLSGDMRISSNGNGIPMLKWASVGAIPLDAEDFAKIAEAAKVWVPYLRHHEADQ